MLWGPPLPERVAPPAAVQALLERALAASPDNPLLHAKLGHLQLDRKDYRAAAESFSTALDLGDAAADTRPLLARCLNYLHRHQDALDILSPVGPPCFERGRALMELGEMEAAEREFRSVLAVDPDEPASCRMLCRLLRHGGRVAEQIAMCEDLADRGAVNAQMLYNWGWALALAGDPGRARRLMFEPERLALLEIGPPAGFADIDAFNAALAEEILTNPNRVGDFPEEDEANRGSCRVDNLFAGRRTYLIDLLLRSIEAEVERWTPAARPGFDPWPRLRPAAARLRPWGLIQRRDEYEEGHIHPRGWLSGVYYVRVPSIVSASGPGPGCIEFGPPSGVAREMPELAPTRRYLPREGRLILAPSHFQHRTIPSGVDEYRISVAFDVIPESRRPGGP
ncbi:MAG TPA: putative 2OG-Fe(II) oxygenase [Allosphingosinicella sp.]|nr:putative 2OG-Fe(II) oxygenase [Allosphingosinicella sp.]